MADEELAAHLLANRIVAQWGESKTEPRAVHEAYSNQEMLQAVLAAGEQANQGYTLRGKEAEASGDSGLAVPLGDGMRDESGHPEETEGILHAWPSQAGDDLELVHHRDHMMESLWLNRRTL